jgi:plasmid stabilization system protein ParE
MRRIVIAASFDGETEAIGAQIEERFGEEARRDFVDDLSRICILIAALPGMGTMRHGYNTQLAAFVLGQNWIFFEFDEAEVHFLHIVNAKRDKRSIGF